MRDPRLWRHTQGVAATAQALAPAFGADPGRAWLAGLLHDWAKVLPPKRVQALALKCGADKFERALPPLMHAPISALLAREALGITDRGVLAAIRYHSTGRPAMGPLEKALFLADFIEPTRVFPGLSALRRLAARDCEAAFRETARRKLTHLIDRRRVVHPRGLLLYNSLL